MFFIFPNIQFPPPLANMWRRPWCLLVGTYVLVGHMISHSKGKRSLYPHYFGKSICKLLLPICTKSKNIKAFKIIALHPYPSWMQLQTTLNFIDWCICRSMWFYSSNKIIRWTSFTN